MRSRRSLKLIAIVGLGLFGALAAAVLQRTARTANFAAQSYPRAYDALGRIARLRSFLSISLGAGHEWAARNGVVSAEGRAPAVERIRREMSDLSAALSADPEQRKRLERLSELVRPGLAPVDARSSGEVEGWALEIDRLLGEMEQVEIARLRGMESLVRSSARTVGLLGVIGTAAVVSVFVFTLGFIGWEVTRRRWAARSVSRLVAKQEKLAERIEYLDKYDPLTGLPNRRSLVAMLERELLWAREGKRFLSVLVTDVNRLQHINDLFGADAGDQALKEIAERLRGAVGGRDIAARFTGGEFAVVLVDLPRTADATARAEQIQKLVSRKIPAGDHGFVVTANTGVALYPEHGRDAQTLLRNADLALAEARSRGRNTIRVFDDHIGRAVSELFLIERRLFGALENGEYVLHYQPCCDLATNQVVGAEALVKWRDVDLGVISASRFIPLLEDTGMIVDVGKWVLETACGQIRDWSASERPLPVSVNLSLVQFRDKYLVEIVSDVLSAFGLDPSRLSLEVTESVCLQDMEFAIKTLKRLKDMGVSVSVDDFGTGYSSLSYLKKLPIDTVKIDISFVRDVAVDPNAASIVTAITSLARSLGLKTIAEGIETEDQRKILHLLRCDQGQGFLFSPALPAGQFESFAERSRVQESAPRP